MNGLKIILLMTALTALLVVAGRAEWYGDHLWPGLYNEHWNILV